MTPSKSDRIAICDESFPTALKSRLLFFDRIAVFDLEDIIVAAHGYSWSSDDFYGVLASDLEFLQSKSIVIGANLFASEVIQEGRTPDQGFPEQMAADLRAYLAANSQISNIYREIMLGFAPARLLTSSKFSSMHDALQQFRARVCAQNMQHSYGLMASSLLSSPLIIPPALKHIDFPRSSTDVVDVVLDKLPMPSERTPWEAILDFKADKEAQGYLQGLKVWMSDVARQKLTATEASEKLDWLLFQHKKHLEMHKLSYRWGSLGGTSVAAAEILEDLAKIKWGKAAGAIVSIFDKRLELMKSELDNPAKEVSYIVKAQEQFGE
jgi:hypothetical protein